jgi:hypothetical protein
MAYTTIDDPSAHFHVNLHTGDGEDSLAITNDANAGDFSPDWLWIKNRTSGGGTGPNYVLDTTRGNTKDVNTDNAEAEHTNATTCLSFDIDGFSVGSAGVVNNDTDSFLAWQWKANGGSRTTNAEDGNNPAGGYQANATAGFSIVDYVGTGAAGTMAHGLGAVPSLIMVKNRDVADAWAVYHSANTSTPETDYLVLNETDETADDATYWNDTAPTSSVFTVNTAHNVNADGENYIAYCFTEIQGYSKFGSYTGNASTDGTFVYLGFKPAWLLIKRTSGSGNWVLMDTKRDTHNVSFKAFNADASYAEESSAYYNMDLLSNGVKFRNLNAETNGDGTTHVYAAFAESPFVTSGGVPCTAR